MKGALLHDHEGLRTFVVVLDHGEDPVATLTAFAVEHRLGASHFTAIGAFSRAVVAYFDWSSKRYEHIPIEEQVEVLSMVGDITIQRGGHLIQAAVGPTLEIVVTEAPRHLRRRPDAASGLALIDPARPAGE